MAESAQYLKSLKFLISLNLLNGCKHWFLKLGKLYKTRKIVKITNVRKVVQSASAIK